MFGPREIKDPVNRERVKESLVGLWNAMDLSRGLRGIRLSDDDPNWEFHYQFYRLVGETLLGEDCPECEIRT